MTRHKRHLMVTDKQAACGLRNPELTTRDPRRVTCGGCQRTLAMADAEMHSLHRKTVR